MVLTRGNADGVLLLTVDRPKAKNALNQELVIALADAIALAERDESTRVVVLSSSTADVFLSGGDLKELAQLDMDAGGAAQVSELGRRLYALETCSLPVVAAVRGATYGGGCELLMMCDLIVMERSAQLMFVHARMGLVPAWGGTTRLMERAGYGVAADLLLRSRALAAPEAFAAGVAQVLADDGTGIEVALELAAELAQRPREALRAIKRSLLASKLARRGDALGAEAKVFRSAWGSEPHRAAFEALGRKTD
jgi:enoyl-CoA hydratase/carnithine racemase